MTRVTIRIPTPLRSFAGGSPAVEVEGTTVKEAMDQLVDRFTGLRRHLFTPDGTLRNFVSVYVNDEDVRQLDRGATRLQSGDTVSIVPAIAGGATEPSARPAQRARLLNLAAPSTLTPDQLRRYSRHLLLPEVGVAGQKKLKEAKVLLIGAGGLGAPSSLYLAAAGVGDIGLVDFDRVELSNLQRQVLYSTRDVGHSKLVSAAARLESMNPDVTVHRHEGHLDSTNAMEILRGYDVVVDGTDNFPTRYLVNDACVLLGKPNVYGSVYRFEGQVSVFDARHGPCYRCLYPEPPPPGLVPSCAEGGVLGVLPGVIGLLQATETVKLILGEGESLVGRLLLFDALAMRFRELKIRKNPECVLCGPHPTQAGLIDYPAFCGVAEEDEISAGVPEVTAKELATMLTREETPFLLDVREPGEWEIAHLPGATLIPRAELPDRVTELTHARDVIVYCKSGVRSAQAVRLLLDLGFNNVRHLKGGIDAWGRDVDSTLPTY